MNMRSIAFLLGLAVMSAACNPILSGRGRIPGFSATPSMPCIGQTVRLLGHNFPAGKVIVRSVPEAGEEPITLGVAEADYGGSCSLDFQLTAEMTRVHPSDPRYRAFSVSADFPNGRVVQSISICEDERPKPSPSVASIPSPSPSPRDLWSDRQSDDLIAAILSEEKPNTITVLFRDEYKIRIRSGEGEVRDSRNHGLISLLGPSDALSDLNALLARYELYSITAVFGADSRSEEDLEAKEAAVEQKTGDDFPNEGSWATLSLASYTDEQIKQLLLALRELPIVRSAQLNPTPVPL